MKAFQISLLAVLVAIACTPQKEKKPHTEAVAKHFDAALKPFYHGVASGDPLPDRVILWTRVTPEEAIERIPIRWEVSEDEAFSKVVAGDTASALGTRDYTFKVDASGLTPNHVYYYRFHALGGTSITGRTKTASVDPADSLQFAVVSCANWEWGYFNAYSHIADRPVLDAVLHLGDYIYEYATGKYGDTTIGRFNIPKHEIVSLEDYRTRYSLYRLDNGLRRVHQQQPFIAIWDDHEVANNATVTGAQNHQPETEGDYEQRKAAAKQAYYEWMPIRESATLYRAYHFGPLADLFMLDERLAGRSPEITDMADPTYNSPERSMLGKQQLEWFTGELKKSTAVWKVIGNQVIFSDVSLKAAYPKMPRNLDSWDGFPVEKHKIVDFLAREHIENVIITSGDTHASWAIEAAVDVDKNYKPFAVELGTTSVSSANGDEYKKSVDTVKMAEQGVLKTNPHIKFLNDRDHGYLLLTLYPDHALAQWYFVESVRREGSPSALAKSYRLTKGTPSLQEIPVKR